MIIIVDYGMGNLRSVQKALERIGVNSQISNDFKGISNAQKIILPGVGNFSRGIENLKTRGLFETLNEAILIKKIPVLGICLGMQLMTSFSEEGNCEGFGWIKAQTNKFHFEGNDLKIPHMGWNNLEIRNSNPLLKNITKNDFFYFVHSFFVECTNEIDVIGTTQYSKTFVSVFGKDNISACQFHPEKSHDAGLKILRNFSEL